MLEQDVFNKISTILVEALNVERVKITPKSSLLYDLNADSLDILDITFRMERAFDVRFRNMTLLPEGVLTPDFVNDGYVTPDGLVKLRELMPHCNFDRFEKNPKADKIMDVLTVQSLVSFMFNKIGAK